MLRATDNNTFSVVCSVLRTSQFRLVLFTDMMRITNFDSYLCRWDDCRNQRGRQPHWLTMSRAYVAIRIRASNIGTTRKKCEQRNVERVAANLHCLRNPGPHKSAEFRNISGKSVWNLPKVSQARPSHTSIAFVCVPLCVVANHDILT